MKKARNEQDAKERREAVKEAILLAKFARLSAQTLRIIQTKERLAHGIDEVPDGSNEGELVNEEHARRVIEAAYRSMNAKVIDGEVLGVGEGDLPSTTIVRDVLC